MEIGGDSGIIAILEGALSELRAGIGKWSKDAIVVGAKVMAFHEAVRGELMLRVATRIHVKRVSLYMKSEKERNQKREAWGLVAF